MAKILWLISQAKAHSQIIIFIDFGKSKHFPAPKKIILKVKKKKREGKLKKRILHTRFIFRYTHRASTQTKGNLIYLFKSSSTPFAQTETDFILF